MNSSEKEAKLAEYVQRELAKLDKASLNYLLSDQRGRWFIMRLFDRCHLLSTTFPDTGNTNNMLVFEGERRVALTILANIREMGEEAVANKQKAEAEYAEFDRRTEEMFKQEELKDA